MDENDLAEEYVELRRVVREWLDHECPRCEHAHETLNCSVDDALFTRLVELVGL